MAATVTYNGEDVLRRYHLLELPLGMTIVLHQFVMSDPDRGYHDHPWSFILSFFASKKRRIVLFFQEDIWNVVSSTVLFQSEKLNQKSL